MIVETIRCSGRDISRFTEAQLQGLKLGSNSDYPHSEGGANDAPKK